ncbi:uncharacterized protein LOC119326347 [Triticum dicoccoides]|uniref:uncharacterized protein LOC119326347 n=1 Tax=Triticum dicoccoides TaxID=85692 RepID=UPI0018915053|nr:uncharacterized protein LOC119326347 [Triticum dicoccoides]
MARGKVAEWIRKRTMPSKSSAGRRSRGSGASEPILPSEAAPESWSSASRAPRKADGSGNGASGSGAPTAHSKSRASAFLSALMRWRPRVNVMAVLWEQVVYHLMWLVESVVVVGRLCFFLMRFGFKKL